MGNLLEDLALPAPAETTDTILARAGAVIERIVSTGQVTGELTQPHDEWVLLLAGATGLWIEGEGEHRLVAGDHRLVPAGARHRVTFTQAQPPTIWLAVHFAPQHA